MSDKRKEIVFQVGEDHGVDESFRLLYSNDRILMPCEPVSDRQIKIGFVDNNNLNVNRLLLTPVDSQPITVHIPKSGELKKVVYPGKSALMFLDDKVDAGFFKKVANRILGQGVDRRDHLHTATVGQIERAGWEVYWAPLQMSGHLLHARLVSVNSKERGVVTQEEAESLLGAFNKEF